MDRPPVEFYGQYCASKNGINSFSVISRNEASFLFGVGMSVSYKNVATGPAVEVGKSSKDELFRLSSEYGRTQNNVPPCLAFG